MGRLYLLFFAMGAYAGLSPLGQTHSPEGAASSSARSALSASPLHLEGQNVDISMLPVDQGEAPVNLRHSDQTSSYQSTNSRWFNELAKKSSMTALQARNDYFRDDAHHRHHQAVERLQGKEFYKLNADERMELRKTKHYFHVLAHKARQQGNHDQSNEFKTIIGSLPTAHYIRKLPSGPITPDLEMKMKRAERFRVAREHRQASAFMLKEFGRPIQHLRKGRPPLDLGKLDPVRARQVAKRRIIDNRKAVRKMKAKEEGKGDTKVAVSTLDLASQWREARSASQ